jgi:hypothetical protein
MASALAVLHCNFSALSSRTEINSSTSKMQNGTENYMQIIRGLRLSINKESTSIDASWPRGVAQAVERLLCKLKPQSLNPNPTKKKVL